MSRTIHVVTHPEATHHVDRLVGGWYDSALTPAGERAAVRIAEVLRASIPEDADVALFASDLRRTLRTARIVGDLLHVEPVVSFPVTSANITTLHEDDYCHNRQVVSLGDTRHLTP
jgi:broad specificity phosphatase PhoE